MSAPDFTGKTVVITFGTTGLGPAIAQRLAAAGAQVVVAGPGGTDAAGVGQGRCRPLDVRVAEECEAFVRDVLDEFGSLDVWINGLPALNDSQDAETVETHVWDDSLALGLTGAFHCSRAAGRHMLSTGRGVIVNLSLGIGQHPVQGLAVDSVVSGALVTLTKALGIEWAPRGVRVVGVATGPLDIAPDIYGDVAVRTPLRRRGTPAEVAEAVLHLASDDADFITAETLPVDGGWRSYQMF